MGEIFKFLGSLETEVQFTLFLLVMLAMAIFPYAGFLGKLIYLWFSNSKSQIVDFSWRLVPDLKIGETIDIDYYVTKSEKPILFNGMSLMLNWHVIGAYKIDIFPIGKNMKGNTAVVPLMAGKNVFILNAHTKKGKLNAEIIIDSSAVYKLATFNISREKYFGQSNSVLLTKKISGYNTKNHKFSIAQNFKRLPFIETKQMVVTNLFEKNGGFNKYQNRVNQFSNIFKFKPIEYQKAIDENPLKKQLQ